MALRLPPFPELLVHLLAVIQAGGLAVPLAASQHSSMTESMQRALDPHLVVAPAVAGVSADGMTGEPGCEWIWQPSAADTAEAKQARLGIFTSGSTGAPRCALLSLSNLRAGADFVIRAHGLGAEDRALGLMPLHHINGIVTTVLAPLLTGGAVVFLPDIPSWVTNPPFYADFPLRRNAEGEASVDPLVIAKWANNSPLAMVASHIPALRSFDAIGADVGNRDGLVNDDTLIHRELDRFGIAHEWEVYEGTHTDKIGQRFADLVLPFFARHLDK